jgi:hypothetical protein
MILWEEAMAAVPIPKTIDAITADWLTQALRAGRSLGEGEVSSFSLEPIAAGVGFMGKLGKLTLNYRGAAGTAPQRLIVKLPTLDPGARGLGVVFRFYEREVRFYREIAGRAGIRVPQCYYADVEPKSGDFVLLLEDLAPAKLGDALIGCNEEQARLAVRDAARLHAVWWQKPELAALDWVPTVNAPIHHFAQPAYQQSWPKFLAFVGDKFPAELRTIGERLGPNIVACLNAITDRPMTLVHGDYRADNLFFGENADGPAMAAVDWQIACRGGGTFDVAYFMSGSVAPELRRAKEMELLQLYCDTLAAGGVKDYGMELCLADYRLSVLYCLTYGVISIGNLDPANERGMALFHVWVDRIGRAILELDAAKAMPA